MSLGKKLFIGGSAACTTDSVQAFGVDSAYSSNVALYQLDGNTNDTAGSHNSTASNVTYSTGKFGQCAVFNGSSQYITTGVDSSDISMTNTSFSCWVNFTATSGTIMDNGGATSTGRGLILETGSGYIVWQQANGTSGQSTAITSASNSYNDGNWHHVVGTIDSNRVMKLYIDGNVESSTPTANSSASSPLYTLEIGRRASLNSQYFNGSIDQVRIYDKSLSSDEVSILYNETTSTASNTNVLGEGSGLALYTLDYDASDAGGNYDGTATDVTFGVDGQINYGASFNGTSSKITLPTGSPFNDSNTIKSISGWIKPDTLTDRVYLYSHSSSTNANDYFYVGYLGDLNRIYVAVRDGSSSNQNNRYANVTLNSNWNHIVAQLNGSTVEIWLNGVKQTVNDTISGSATSSSWIDYPTYDSAVVASIGIQRAYDPNYSNGLIDQVRIFSKALSSSEISTLYAETACVYTSTTDQVDYQGTNIAYYKLDGNALDETSNNYDGTESNITYEFGRYGTAAVFNGSSSIIKDVLGSGFTYASKTMTFSAWIFVEDASNDNMIIGDGLTTSTGGWGISTGYGNAPNRSLAFSVASAAMGGVQQTYSSISVLDKTWTHIVVSVDFSSVTDSVKMYINGTEDTSLTDGISGTFVDNTTYNTAIGGTWTGSAGRLFEGKIDQVRIYNSALDATAVANLYNEKQAYITKDASNPFVDGNEEAFYKMETASGTNVADSTSTNSGTAYSVTFTSGSGLFGTYAADFTGSPSRIELNSTNVADVVTFDGAGSTDECTLSFWVQPQGTSTTTYYCVFSVGYGLELYYLNGRFTSFSNNTASGTGRNINGFQTTGTYSINEWHHLVFTFTPTAQNWYVNGVIDGSNTTTSYTPYAEPDATIGTFRNTSPAYNNLATFDGLIDHVRIFDRVLDGDEVFKLYAEIIN